MKIRLTILVLVSIYFASGDLCGQALNVMTYNIRFDNPADGVNQWSSRTQKVYALIKKYNPDIFGVQEALYGQLKDLEENLPEYTFIGVGRDNGKQKGEYSAIFFKKERIKVVEQNTFWLSETPEVPGSKSWDAAITRVATWAKFHDKQSDQSFFFINTHFDHIGKEARKNSAQLLIQKISTLAVELPVIVTGDFNCTRDEAPYQVMVSPLETKLIDPAPSQAPGTFCNFGVNSMPCRAIDYIFHSPDWNSANYQVISDNDGVNYPSDHLPVMVTLTLQATR